MEPQRGVSLGPGLLPQDTQGSHRQKELKACHQGPQKPNPTGNETDCFKNKGKVGKGSRAEQLAGRVHRAKGNEEEFDKIKHRRKWKRTKLAFTPY